MTGIRTFYTLIITQIISSIGSQISSISFGIWIYADTGDATPLGLVAFFNMLPKVVLSNISGVLADRWDRRYVMALADAGQAVGTVLLFLTFAAGTFQLWHLYAITALKAMFAIFQDPAFAASVTVLVPDKERDRANTWMQMAGPIGGIIAPAITGIIYAVSGVMGAILIDLISFLIAFVVVLRIHIPRPERTKIGEAYSGSFWTEFKAGMSFLWNRKPLLILVVYTSVVNFLISGMSILFTPYLLARTGDSAILGILLSFLNAGAIIGGVLFSLWGGTRPRIHTVMLGMILVGVILAGFGMAQSLITLGIMVTLFLVPIPAVNSAMMSIMQIKTPPDIQGRVFAVLGQVSLLISPIAYLLIGPIVDALFEPAVGKAGWESLAPFFGNSVGAGMGLLITLMGTGCVIVTLLFYALPLLRHIEAILPDYNLDSADEETPVDAELSPA